MVNPENLSGANAYVMVFLLTALRLIVDPATPSLPHVLPPPWDPFSSSASCAGFSRPSSSRALGKVSLVPVTGKECERAFEVGVDDKE